MSDRQEPNVSTRSHERISTRKPRWGFSKGLLTGVAIEVPAITATVWVLAQLGIGNAEVPFMRVMRLTAVFAGIAALFTAGGIGRLAAYAALAETERSPEHRAKPEAPDQRSEGSAETDVRGGRMKYGLLDGGRRRAMFVAARAHAAASTGLVLIAAIPHGQLPSHLIAWLAFLAGGLVAGAACGALIGLVCGGTAPVELADVWSLARRPSEALRSWLDPRELVRLGAAVRHRTTNLFGGMFDPAPLPPAPPAPDANPPAGSAVAPSSPPNVE